MSEKELDVFVRELKENGTELYSFVAENTSEDLSDEQMDVLVSELEGDYLSLREFVINALEL
ncbi:hypothetical protein [Lysinibacillus pakistanensis]|uniref:hypothetical protein n=1 Tax=Lysinibacillus pakistanensis TaxID=759811 RepID=UPI003D2BF066